LVLKARHKATGQIVAIKKFKESDEDEQVRKTALREIRILKQLRHDNIVSLLDVFRRNGKLYLVFEYVQRTILEDLEANPTGLDSKHVKSCFYQLIQSLEFIHSHNVSSLASFVALTVFFFVLAQFIIFHRLFTAISNRRIYSCLGAAC
jgi:cyclin-dependent kinase-like